MLVFAGLFGHCDKAGRFPWKPRQLKLDILPFLQFDMAEALAVLEQAGQIARYSIAGAEYGWIPTFQDHQAIGGKEAAAPAKYPEPPSEVMGKYRGSNRDNPQPNSESTETAGREGKGRELGKEGNRSASASPVDKKTNGNGAWWKSDAGIKAKGEELNMPARPGEEYAQYKDRLFQAIKAAA